MPTPAAPHLPSGSVLALSGGVGGAKLARGLYDLLPEPRSLTVVCNTADDFEHLGLYIAPDLDSVLYALADVHDPERGWGRRDEGWRFMEAVRELGGEDWFQLGDRDLATHVLRTAALRSGASLSEVTAELAAALGVRCALAPMTDDRVSTRVLTREGEIAFQEYFVRQRCEPTVSGFRFTGIDGAEPAAAFARALADPALTAVVLCPSNPFVSIDPILALSGIEGALRHSTPVVAVSPIVGGEALKGPAAKMMHELGLAVDAVTVARHYAQRGLLDGFVLDHRDARLADAVRALGVSVAVTETVMTDAQRRSALARAVLDLAAACGG